LNGLNKVAEKNWCLRASQSCSLSSPIGGEFIDGRSDTEEKNEKKMAGKVKN
jgi:hypothetical protein